MAPGKTLTGYKRVRCEKRVKKEVRHRKIELKSIGAPGFEPGAFPPQTGCATRLRHAPKL